MNNCNNSEIIFKNIEESIIIIDQKLQKLLNNDFKNIKFSKKIKIENINLRKFDNFNIIICGDYGCGKSFIIKKLSENYGLIYRIKYISKYLNKIIELFDKLNNDDDKKKFEDFYKKIIEINNNFKLIIENNKIKIKDFLNIVKKIKLLKKNDNLNFLSNDNSVNDEKDKIKNSLLEQITVILKIFENFIKYKFYNIKYFDENIKNNNENLSKLISKYLTKETLLFDNEYSNYSNYFVNLLIFDENNCFNTLNNNSFVTELLKVKVLLPIIILCNRQSSLLHNNLLLKNSFLHTISKLSSNDKEILLKKKFTDINKINDIKSIIQNINNINKINNIITQISIYDKDIHEIDKNYDFILNIKHNKNMIYKTYIDPINTLNDMLKIRITEDFSNTIENNSFSIIHNVFEDEETLNKKDKFNIKMLNKMLKLNNKYNSNNNYLNKNKINYILPLYYLQAINTNNVAQINNFKEDNIISSNNKDFCKLYYSLNNNNLKNYYYLSDYFIFLLRNNIDKLKLIIKTYNLTENDINNIINLKISQKDYACIYNNIEKIFKDNMQIEKIKTIKKSNITKTKQQKH
jgi:hypothetical protein